MPFQSTDTPFFTFGPRVLGIGCNPILASAVNRAITVGRPLRIQAPGLTYHVTARGVRRTPIYLDDVDRSRFLTLLREVVEHFALQCHAYCEMTNHYHVALTTNEANLSRAVRQLNGTYAQWWNWRHKRVGHVFQSRFHAQIVQDDRYLANVCQYIVLNPVRADMVSSPEQWPWSSYRATAGLIETPSFLHIAKLLEAIAREAPGTGTSRFRESVLERIGQKDLLPRDTILGDDAFVAHFRSCRANASREVPRHEGRRTLEAIFQGAVTRSLRNEAVVVAYQERFTLAEIARYLDVHPSTISKIVTTKVPGHEKTANSRPDPTA